MPPTATTAHQEFINTFDNNNNNNDDANEQVQVRQQSGGGCLQQASKTNLFFEIINGVLSYLKKQTNNNNSESKMQETDDTTCDTTRIRSENDEDGKETELEFVCYNEEDNGMDIKNGDDDRTMQLAIVPLSDSVSVTLSSSNSRMRVALGVLIRLLLPVANKLTRGWNGLRGGGLLRLIHRIRETHGLLTTLLAYAANTVSMGLSSVQVSNRFDPLLRVIKLKRDPLIRSNSLGPSSSVSFSSFHRLSAPSLYQQQQQHPQRSLSCNFAEPNEKCVDCRVLAEPPPGQPITADIIFIHGLHGSLVNTWKQGLWTSEGKLDHFNRPPKPPIRPPKRQRHSRSTLVVPAMKRARFCDNFNVLNGDTEIDDTFELKHKVSTTIVADDEHQYTYECGEPEEIEYHDDVEYSFPTFRLRVDDLENNEPVKLTHNNKCQRLKKPKKDASWSPCWPGDWLPLDCPGVRVIAINYTTDPYLWRPLWVKKRNRSGLVERAREMSEMLIEKKVGEGHPIVWVGHSKGGIFIKQMIVDAWESGRAAAKNLFYSSRGCFFYSVPHLGSSLADFNLPLLRQSIELTEIQKNCPSILDLHRRFVALYRAGHLKVDVFSFVETALTLMSVLYLRIVTIDSADPGIGEVCGVHLDHREICKPRSRDCFLYTELVKMINNLKY